jgi:hypothetical protein
VGFAKVYLSADGRVLERHLYIRTFTDGSSCLIRFSAAVSHELRITTL